MRYQKFAESQVLPPSLGGRWSPVGTVQDRPSRQARRSLSLVLIERIAHVRAEGRLPSQSPNGASSPEGGAKSRLPLWGRCHAKGMTERARC